MAATLTLRESMALACAAFAAQEAIGISSAQLAAASVQVLAQMFARHLEIEIRAGRGEQAIAGIHDLVAVLHLDVSAVLKEAEDLHQRLRQKQARPSQPPKNVSRN